MKKRRLCVRSALFSGALLTFMTVGCGSGSNNSSPESSIAATQNPLVAQYNLTIPGQHLGAWVEFGPDTTYGRQTSATAATTGFVQQTASILVAGMKPSTTYHMRAHVNWYGGGVWVDQDQTFTTGALPASLKSPGITVTRPTRNLSPAPGVELLSLIEPPQTNMLQTVVTDLEGNVIWYYPPGGAVPIKPMQNGHFILNISAGLQEIDLAGNLIRNVTVEQVNQSLQMNDYPFSVIEFSHDVLVLDNGHWIGLASISKDFTDLPGYPGTTSVIGDVLVDVDLNGNVVWAWSAFDHLDVNRHLQGLPDWTHSNAIVYTPDGNLLLSMRHQSWILKIDYANGAGAGDILWRLGEDGDFALLGGDPSEWFYGQHYPNLLGTDGSQSTLAVWDDGNLRLNSAGVACGSTPSAPACYSRATIFQIDDSTRIASLVWDDLPGFYCFWGGSIGTLSNGNVEFDVTTTNGGPASQIMEVTHTDNPQTVWQMNITGENAYRGYRIPSLYPRVTWQ
jgi:arylsulfate sulfotransferase